MRSVSGGEAIANHDVVKHLYSIAREGIESHFSLDRSRSGPAGSSHESQRKGPRPFDLGPRDRLIRLQTATDSYPTDTAWKPPRTNPSEAHYLDTAKPIPFNLYWQSKCSENGGSRSESLFLPRARKVHHCPFFSFATSIPTKASFGTVMTRAPSVRTGPYRDTPANVSLFGWWAVSLPRPDLSKALRATAVTHGRRPPRSGAQRA